MANVLVERKSLEDVADAIRVKLNTQNLFRPEEFAARVMDIEVCSSGYGRVEYYTDNTYTTTAFVEITSQEEINSLGPRTLVDTDTKWYGGVGSVNINYSNVKSVTLREDATSIPGNFLANSTHLASVNIAQSSISTIPHSFLYGVRSNPTVTLPSAVTEIGDYFIAKSATFNRQLVLPNTITQIGTEFLLDCEAFNQGLVLPDNLTSIGQLFMKGCNSFSSTIDVKDYPFWSGRDLSLCAKNASDPLFTTGVAIKGTAAADWVWNKYTTDQRGTISHSGVVERGHYRCVYAFDYEYTVPTNSLVLMDGTVVPLTAADISSLANPDASYDDTVTIGETTFRIGDVYGIDISGLNISSLPDGFLVEMLCLQRVVLPNTLTSIGEEFMRNCYSYRHQLIIPNGVTAIGDSFMITNKLFNHALTLPSNITVIHSSFLGYCYRFNGQLTLPASLTQIENYFLAGGQSFNQAINFPPNITSIGKHFLEDCMAYNQPISFPQTIVSIGIGFLSNCEALIATINLGSLAALVVENDAQYELHSFATTANTAPAYTTGMTIVGDYASDWATKFPNGSLTTPVQYRNLIVGTN